MSREHWYNLWRSFRIMKKQTDYVQSLLWIAHYNINDALIVWRLIK